MGIAQVIGMIDNFQIGIGLFGRFSNSFDDVTMCTAAVCAATLITFHFH